MNRILYNIDQVALCYQNHLGVGLKNIILNENYRGISVEGSNCQSWNMAKSRGLILATGLAVTSSCGLIPHPEGRWCSNKEEWIVCTVSKAHKKWTFVKEICTETIVTRSYIIPPQTAEAMVCFTHYPLCIMSSKESENRGKRSLEQWSNVLLMSVCLKHIPKFLPDIQLVDGNFICSWNHRENCNPYALLNHTAFSKWLEFPLSCIK